MSTHEQEEDAFGFAAVSTTVKEKLRQIRPSLPPEETANLARIDAVADSAGFVSREVRQTDYRKSRNQTPEPRIPLNMRVPVSLGAAFQRFCEDNRYSYPEALAEIMRRAGLPTK